MQYRPGRVSVVIPYIVPLIVTLSVVAPPTLILAARDASDLSIVIVPTKNETGALTIERANKFQVLITNESNKSIRLWSSDSQPGHDILSFRIENEGQTSLIRTNKVTSAAWKDERPSITTIEPGETLTRDVALTDIFWGEQMWTGIPEPNTGKLLTMTAILEVNVSDDARKLGVWTGRVTSKPIKIHVVDPKLRTPYQYLWAQCPNQALAALKADNRWIAKRDESRCTPLHLAASFDFVEVVRWLLDHGADVNTRGYNGCIALDFTDSPEIVKLLITKMTKLKTISLAAPALEAAAEKCARFEHVPSLAAEREKAQAILKLLLEAGVYYDIRSACFMDDIERVRVLVADEQQAKDKQALRWAATYGRAKIVKLLLEHGADPEDAGYGGLTISYFSIEHPDILKLLFDAGANPAVRVEYNGNGVGPQGSTLLHAAAWRGFVESAKLLLSRGLDVNLTDVRGATALHEAARGGHPPIVEFLLQNGSNANTRSKQGWTPMARATAEIRPDKDSDNEKFQAIIRRLERAGVELHIFAAIACNDP